MICRRLHAVSRASFLLHQPPAVTLGPSTSLSHKAPRTGGTSLSLSGPDQDHHSVGDNGFPDIAADGGGVNRDSPVILRYIRMRKGDVLEPAGVKELWKGQISEKARHSNCIFVKACPQHVTSGKVKYPRAADGEAQAEQAVADALVKQSNSSRSIITPLPMVLGPNALPLKVVLLAPQKIKLELVT
ncbi:hypothetical protein DFH08DRAFT_827974 [Mycena albidolilacea]|uniref:Uncharacterized protein n=1 Tax=Mycena albidolilacea TaxID=1033008 RepID=A0AAD6YXS2_9AGAR|nr:hypothetical protein DFH08DRAFT_827974 [Mycena albidolilacea]